MTTETSSLLGQLEQEGFTILPEVYDTVEVEEILQGLTRALEAPTAKAAIRSQTGSVYAARNVLTLWPATASVWRRPPLPATLAAILGPRFGLVRVLYFDKPPDRTWSLPWHKDMTIAVKDNRLPSDQFGKPTRKAGVPHVEASRAVLESMLTVRIHLDDITEENGPLQVIPGSQRTGKVMQLGDAVPRAILARRGDVLLIRPLVAHCSLPSLPGTRRHRRLLHLEFAATPDLPDGYAWHDFIAADSIP